jgi:hypothetical protein
LDQFEHLVGSLAKGIEALTPLVQGFGGLALAVVLLVPILMAAFARQLMSVLAATLLSFVCFLLFMTQPPAFNTLAVASGIGSFLVAVQGILARRRAAARNVLIAEMTDRLGQLEQAEHRRLMSDLKGRQPDGPTGPASSTPTRSERHSSSQPT